LARERAVSDLAFIAVSVGEGVRAGTLRLPVLEAALDHVAVLREVAALPVHSPTGHLAFVAIAAREAVDARALGLAVDEGAVEGIAALRGRGTLADDHA